MQRCSSFSVSWRGAKMEARVQLANSSWVPPILVSFDAWFRLRANSKGFPQTGCSTMCTSRHPNKAPHTCRGHADAYTSSLRSTFRSHHNGIRQKGFQCIVHSHEKETCFDRPQVTCRPAIRATNICWRTTTPHRSKSTGTHATVVQTEARDPQGTNNTKRQSVMHH